VFGFRSEAKNLASLAYNMDIQTFLNLPTEAVAQYVREGGLKVCVMPMNGTRRWYTLEYGEKAELSFEHYFETTRQRHIDICKMFFEHGIETLLTPAFGVYVQNRGERYMQLFAESMSQLASNPAYTSFYNDYDVRVRFYGDYRKHLTGTKYASVCDLFDHATKQTITHSKHRLLFGIFAHDAAETTAELAIRYFQERGGVPDKATLIEMYYGEPLPPADLFIGFSKFRAFDMPLLTTGRESLYFTVSPSFYFDQYQLRQILYDFLFARRSRKLDYAELSPESRAELRGFYQTNAGQTIGVGRVHPLSGVWYPLPQVKLPETFEKE
jgi:hypothetical protein